MESTHNNTTGNWRNNHSLLLKLLIVIIIADIAAAAFYFRRHIKKPQPLHVAAPRIELDSSTIKQRDARTELIQSLPIGKNDIVFLGNSITEFFPLQEMFHDLNIKNKGVATNTSKDILNRLNYIINGQPKKIFLQVGINDIVRELNTDTLFANFITICKEIQQKTPNTKLYVQSIFPTAFTEKKFNPAINAYNNKIKQYCSEHQINYIDLYTSFIKNNVLDSTLTYDGVHLKAKGYFLWQKLIEKQVAE